MEGGNTNCCSHRVYESKTENENRTSNLYEFNSQGLNIPLKENWNQRSFIFTKDFIPLYKQILDFEIRDDDVFVVTFPKCGTNWIAEATWLLVNNLNFSKANEVALHERAVFLDKTAINGGRGNSVEQAAKLESPRLIKSHLPAHFIPQRIWSKKTKIIYCARNPKDVVVSFYHFLKNKGSWTGSLDEFADELLESKLLYSPYWPSVLDFWQMRNESNVFFTTYEDMKRDLRDVVKRLAKFLERPLLTEVQLETLVEFLSFEKMKASKTSNMTETVAKSSKNPSNNFEFMRRGIVGSYKNELSPQTQAKIDEWSSNFLEQYNLKTEDIFGAI